MNCPDPERAAAHVEGRLDPAEESLHLEHCADCESCRLELALLGVLRGRPEGPSEALPSPVRRAVLRAAALERRGRRPTARGAHRPAWVVPAAAALLAVLVGGAVLAGIRFRPRPSLPDRPLAVPRRTAPPPEPLPPPPAPEESLRAVPPTAPPVGEPPADLPAGLPLSRGETPPPTEPRSDSPPPPPAVPAPLAGTRAEDLPPPPPSVPTVTRTYTPVLITDAGLGIRLHRKGTSRPGTLTGPAPAGEGDVLSAEQAGGFRLDGGPAIILGEGTRITVACAAPDPAVVLRLHAGEAVVEPREPANWILGDGRIEITLHRAAGRFAVFPSGDRLATAAFTEPLHAQAGGEGPRRVKAGHVLLAGRGGSEVRPADSSESLRIQVLLEAGRPRRRTIFFTSCDPADMRRGHAFVLEGSFLRQEALLSREGPGRTSSAAIIPNPRFPWRDNLVLGFRFATNATSLQVGLRVEERQYTLLKSIPVERRHVNLWRRAEVLLALSNLGFSRDDGQMNLVVGPQDLIEAIRFTVHPKDVFGDQRAYVAVDDVEVFERE